MDGEDRGSGDDAHSRGDYARTGWEAIDALQKMIRTGEGRLPVVKDRKVAGMITRKDILNLLEIRTDLGG
ncbi:MAG: CBS domain-containing protein [Syntrophaceae bacterium]|nr:CBS domain-containing protein [Syntrophaceae bacterium]